MFSSVKFNLIRFPRNDPTYRNYEHAVTRPLGRLGLDARTILKSIIKYRMWVYGPDSAGS